MTLIRKLVLVACWALLLTSYSASINAQDIDPLSQATGNLITGTWTGAPGSTVGPGGVSGGSTPVYNTNTGTLQFGYTQRTVSQSIAINQALANAGTGVQVNGFQYGWNYFNQDMNRGTLTGNISLTSNTGAVLQSYTYSMPQTTGGWTQVSGSQNFVTPYALNAVGNLNVSFTGKDDRFWAGYYGPLVKDIDVRLRYGVDPCATNPAYSPNCAGFSSVVTSPNLVPYPDAYAVFGGGVNNSFAINKAFETAGTGLQIHGFKWGYVANANEPYCAFAFIMMCFDERNPSVTTNVNITSNTGASLYNVTRTYQNSYNTTNYQYLFPSSQQLGNLGSFNFTATANDQAYVGQMWSRALYTPDQCMLNPLSSPTCPGYAKAMATQTSTITTGDTTTSTTTVTTSPSTTITTSPTTTTITADVSQPLTTTTTTTSSSSTTSTPTTTAATAPTTTVTPTATNPQPKVGEVTTAGSAPAASKSSSGPSTSQILNSVRAEQSRISALETSTAMAAVEQSQQVGTKTANDAQSIAVNQQMQSSSNAQTVATTIMSSTQSATQSNLSSQSSGSGLSMFSIQSNGFSIGTFRGPDLYSLTTTNQTTGPALLTTINSNQNYNNRPGREELRTFEQNSSFEQRQSLSATNPLTTVMNPPPILAPMPPAPTGPSVNKDVKDNDAAGGLSIASIAKQPQGFELYMSGLQDRPFYSPKEVYRGQKVVDNARAQRMLSGANDRLHQEMVDSQYDRK